MLSSKNTTLKPLLESEDGIHLTAYLVNRGNIHDLELQLRTAVIEAAEWLASAVSPEDRERFLEPLNNLAKDARILGQMKGNIGLFRTFEMFRILNVPVEVEPLCHVATSFHVKPLLRWLQTDREFLLLGIDKQAAYLYMGNQEHLRLVDSIWLPVIADASVWLRTWIQRLANTANIKLFVAGDKVAIEGLVSDLRYSHVAKTPIASSFSPQDVGDICLSLRKVLADEAKKDLDKALLEFRFAEEGNRARKNIFKIAKAVVQGKVRKLIVTDELSIFGKIDRKSGGLAIHPFDLDHEDDDILDDLAQIVLSQGGEVVIAKRNEIPKGRPILAILDDEGSALEKRAELQQRFE